MVDYVAVLRRTIDALPKNTPEIRERVYEKARQTVQAKLGMINPAPSQALIDKQLKGLETAISTVEADFTVAVEPEVSAAAHDADPLMDVLRGLPNLPDAASPAHDYDLSNMQARDRSFEQEEHAASPRDVSGFPRMPDAVPFQHEPHQNDQFDDVFGDQNSSQASSPFVVPSLDDPVVPPVFSRPARPKVKAGRVLVPLLGIALLAGAGALAWTERDRIVAMLEPVQPPVVAAQPEAPAETPPAAPAEPAQTAAVTKFTQRLNEDGTESDAGAGTAAGEQSVAQLEPAAEQPAAPEPTPAAEPAATPAAQPAAEPAPAAAEPAPAAEAIPVGQKAIFYEERTSGAEGSARPGAVVWSVVRESPGNDRPPEAAVRGELSIPEAGLNVRLTLRRNADATLPASHILELIMTVPEDFAGGTIEDVQRVNLKPSEESAGAPLAATPVKVADKYFLVALENNAAATKANLELLRNQSWIDLPVVYRSGRRALFTMEKGLVGDQIFKQVLDAWDAAPLQ